ncbi:hypothetical protein WQ53_10665 [Pseudoxanthomonas suwonensis]|uniref:Uncharacterized protein n=1 Tax=Pseudoxanthomonas suwonensis TaxID=314722 RepID=A0A0E3Z277_9GAMM|nr:hypothetical protein WQ53_10665 [Pseudoxanthomonas suwonensis]
MNDAPGTRRSVGCRTRGPDRCVLRSCARSRRSTAGDRAGRHRRCRTTGACGRRSSGWRL